MLKTVRILLASSRSERDPKPRIEALGMLLGLLQAPTILVFSVKCHITTCKKQQATSNKRGSLIILTNIGRESYIRAEQELIALREQHFGFMHSCNLYLRAKERLRDYAQFWVESQVSQIISTKI